MTAFAELLIVTYPLLPRPYATWLFPSSHQFVTAVPATALWKPTMPAISVQRCVQTQALLEQLASGTDVADAPGAPASLLSHV